MGLLLILRKYAIAIAVQFYMLFVLFACTDTPNIEEPNSIGSSYAFFVAGHVYGNPKTRRTAPDDLGLYPIFMEKVHADILESQIEFGFFTGDIVYRNSIPEWEAVDRDVLSLDIPVHFVPGNHDVANRTLFTSRYTRDGKTYQKFGKIGDDLFIVLDPNLNNWSIVGEQLDFLKGAVSNADNHKNVFVFVHQVLWWDKANVYKSIAVNSIEGRGDHVNFWSSVEPLFGQLANEVYIFAGDTGVAENAVPTYDHYGNIHLISSGMGGGVNDNYLQVFVDSNRKVNIRIAWLNSDRGKEDFMPTNLTAATLPAELGQ